MLKSLARFACALAPPLTQFKSSPTQHLIKVILPLVAATALICSVLLLFALKAPVVQAAPQPSQAIPEQQDLIPPARPLADATGVLTVAHTASTTHQMNVYGNGRITNRFLADNISKTNQISNSLTTTGATTTLAILFDQHPADSVDVGVQDEFSMTTSIITLSTASNIPGYQQDTYALYASRVLSYEIAQRTFANYADNCVVMELIIKNTGNPSLTGGKLLYMVDTQVGELQVGDEGGRDISRKLIYQTDYYTEAQTGYAFGIALLEGDLQRVGSVGNGKHPNPRSDASLISAMLTTTHPITDGDDNVSWLVAKIPALASTQVSTLSFGLCSRTMTGTNQTLTQNAARQALVANIDQLIDLSVLKKSDPVHGSSITVGAPITYNITLTNEGTHYINDVIITDIIPASTALITYLVSQGNITRDQESGVITAHVGRLYAISSPVVMTVVVTSPLTVANRTPLTNQAFIDSGPIVAATNIVTHQLFRKPALQVEKKGPDQALVNQPLTFSFTITNNQQDENGLPLKIVSVSDNIASPPVYASGDISNTGKLDMGETWVYTANYIVPISSPHLLTNIVTVVGQDPLSQSTVTTASHATTINHQPKLSIDKEGPSTATVGETVTFTFSINHHASSDRSPVKDIQVQDNIAGLAEFTQGDDNSNQWIDYGESWEYIATYTIKPTDTVLLKNTGRVSGKDLDDHTIIATDIHELIISGYNPALTILKEGPISAEIGEMVLFTFTITNDIHQGDGSPVSTVTLRDNLIGLITNRQIISGNQNSTLEMNEIWRYMSPYTIPLTSSPLTNTAIVTGQDAEQETITAAASHNTHILPRIGVDKKGPSEAKVGELVTFTFTVTHDLLNGSGAPITITTVNDSIVGSATYVSGDGDNSGQLEESETWTYTVSYIIPYTSPAHLTNVVTVTGKDILSNTVVATDVHTTQINYNPRINVSKSSPTTTAAVGDKVVYTFEVKHENTSDGSPIHNIILNDNITGPPIGPVYQQGNTDEFLTKDELWKYSVTYTIQPTDDDPLANIVTVIGYGMDGEQTIDHGIHVITPIHHSPILSLTKQGPSTAKIGDSVVYTFTLTNDITQGDGSPIKIVLPIDDDIIGSVTNPSKKNGDFDEWLEIGENWVYRANYTISTTFPNPLINTAIVQGEDLDNQTVTATATHSTYLLPHINVDKDGPDEAKVGELITFTFTLTNDPIKGSGLPVTITLVTDTIADVFTNPKGDDNQNNMLEVGEKWVYIAAYTILPNDPRNLVNKVTTSAIDPRGNIITATDHHTTTIEHHPILQITKDGPDQAQVGTTITYTFDVRQSSSLLNDISPVNIITVTDGVAGLATLLSKIDENNNGLLDTHDTWTYVTTYTVPATAPHLLRKPAIVTGTDLDNDLITDTSPAILTIIEHRPILSIVKTGPMTAEIGDPVVFTFTLSNKTPPGDGSHIKIDTLIKDNIIGSITNSPKKQGDFDGWLEVGETWIYTINYTMPSTPGLLMNTAIITGRDVEGDRITAKASHTTTLLTSDVGLKLTKSGPSTATVGDRVVFTFTVNQDTMNDDNPSVNYITVTDNIAGAAYYVEGDDNDNEELDANEKWTFATNYWVTSRPPITLISTGIVTGYLEEQPITATSIHDMHVIAATHYLPMIFKGYRPPLPDLIIERLTSTSNNILLTIKNKGDAPVTKAFWVDVYIDPPGQPTYPRPHKVNQTWGELGYEFGLAWAVAETISVGEVITLTVGDLYYRADKSELLTPLPVGTLLHAQADSLADSSLSDRNYGNVIEISEPSENGYNNIMTDKTINSPVYIPLLLDTSSEPPLYPVDSNLPARP